MLVNGLPKISRNLEHRIACMYYGLNKHIKVGYLLFFLQFGKHLVNIQNVFILNVIIEY